MRSSPGGEKEDKCPEQREQCLQRHISYKGQYGNMENQQVVSGKLEHRVCVWVCLCVHSWVCRCLCGSVSISKYLCLTGVYVSVVCEYICACVSTYVMMERLQKKVKFRS